MILQTVINSEITIFYLYSTYSTFGGLEYSSFWIIILLKGGVIMDTQKIGRFIAEARKNKKMTQAEFGEYLNVTDKSVSKWECGKCMPDSSLFEGISKVLEVSVNELLKGEYIEQENEEVENNKNTILLLNEIQKLKRNESLVGGLCALLISFITVIYSAIYKPGIKAYEQFFAGFIKAISAGCLVIGILLIFNAWVKYSIRNSNKDKR